MGIYEELQARGLIAQVTDEERIKELVNNGKATFYIGFDPTADSLHVGHFMALCQMCIRDRCGDCQQTEPNFRQRRILSVCLKFVFVKNNEKNRELCKSIKKYKYY